VLSRNDHLSVGQLFRYNYFHFSEMRKKLDKNRNTVVIVGIDKPRCYIDQESNFYTTFIDGIANMTTINDFNNEYTNVRTELFYWSKDAMPIACKQAHVIKRWLEANPKSQSAWKGLNISRSRLIQERLMRSLLYSNWDNNWFQANKSTSFWQTEFDTWFHNRTDLAREQELWRKGVEYMCSMLGDQIMYKDGLPSGLKQFIKPYLIGQIKTVV